VAVGTAVIVATEVVVAVKGCWRFGHLRAEYVGRSAIADLSRGHRGLKGLELGHQLE
jgi:hypothetical protein